MEFNVTDCENLIVLTYCIYHSITCLLVLSTTVKYYSGAGVVGTIAKLAKICTLRITTNKVYFILSERMITGGSGIWCELLQVGIMYKFDNPVVCHCTLIVKTPT